MLNSMLINFAIGNLYGIYAFKVDSFIPKIPKKFCQKIPEFSEEKAMVHNVEQFVVMVLRLNFGPFMGWWKKVYQNWGVQKLEAEN